MQTYFCPTRIHMGAGVHARVGEALRSLKADRVLILADGAVLGDVPSAVEVLKGRRCSP
jgi:alcohol dehydrogenase class IV